MKQIPELSVFLPTFNEAESINDVILKTKKVLLNVANKWEIIVVNDGSTDNTPEVVNKLIEKDPNIKLENHSQNQGYGIALRTGFYKSQFNWIAFIDSDNQFNFAEITKFIEKQKDTGADLVIGYYKKRQVSKFKIITSRLWEFSVHFLFGLKVHDIDCGFKLISKKVFKKIPPLESERGAFISSELLIKAQKEGFKIEEVPVTHYPRKTGKGTGRHLRVIIKSFIDLLRLWKKLR